MADESYDERPGIELDGLNYDTVQLANCTDLSGLSLRCRVIVKADA